MPVSGCHCGLLGGHFWGRLRNLEIGICSDTFVRVNLSLFTPSWPLPRQLRWSPQVLPWWSSTLQGSFCFGISGVVLTPADFVADSFPCLVCCPLCPAAGGSDS